MLQVSRVQVRPQTGPVEEDGLFARRTTSLDIALQVHGDPDSLEAVSGLMSDSELGDRLAAALLGSDQAATTVTIKEIGGNTTYRQTTLPNTMTVIRMRTRSGYMIDLEVSAQPC